MIILRKGKKIINKYESAFAVAEDTATLEAYIPSNQIEAVQKFIVRNAFGFAIRGAKARLGNGLMLETTADA